MRPAARARPDVPLTRARDAAVALLDASEDGGARVEDADEPLGAGTGVPLRAVDAVAAHVRAIEDARAKVTAEMETMVLGGLTTLVRPSAPPAFPPTRPHALT